MNDASPENPLKAKASHKLIIILTVLATLAFVFVLEKLLVLTPDSESRARVKRSEALLAAQERRNQGYQVYYEGVMEDHKRVQALLSRQEQDATEFEKILRRWEEQQKTYQEYLDSLKQR